MHHPTRLNGTFYALAIGLAGVLGSQAEAAVVVSDSAFNDSDWSASVYESTRFPDGDDDADGGVQSVGQEATDGNPGEYRELTFEVGASATDTDRIAVFDGYTAGVYDPGTQGEIVSLDYSEDRRKISGGGTVGGLYGLMQGGVVFEQSIGTHNFTNTAWDTITISGLTAADFTDATDGTSNPDFTASGAPITFGYIRFGGTNDAGRTIVAGIDNFEYTITLVPEPASLALLSLGGLCLLPRRRA